MKKGRLQFALAFLAPAVLLYGLFVLLPLIQSFQLTFYRWRGVSAKRTFVGFENLSRLAQDSVFFDALKHNLWILVVGGSVMLGLSLLVAHGAQGSGPFAKFVRGVYLFPQVISMVVVAILWTFLYNPSFGLITGAMKAVGLSGLVRPWLGDSQAALPAVTIAFIWHGVGFYVMLFSAGIRSIPAEVFEACELDGARGYKKFRLITWPLLWSVKRVAVIQVVIAVMNSFALVYLMTSGGPDRKTELMLTYLYEQAFKNSQFGYATALAAANFVIAMVLTGLVMFFMRRDPSAVRA